MDGSSCPCLKGDDGPVVADELVGRDEALARLRAAADGAAAGWGRLVLVAGEPGIGKTALVTRATEHAADA